MIQAPEQYYYRNASIIGRVFTFAGGIHGVTVRASYTVPANKMFHLCSFLSNLHIVAAAAGQGYIRIDINGVTIAMAAIDTGTLAVHGEQGPYLDIHCKSGDIIDIASQNTGAGTVLMVGTFSGNEYDAL